MSISEFPAMEPVSTAMRRLLNLALNLFLNLALNLAMIPAAGRN